MVSLEIDAVYIPGVNPKRMCTIVGFEHVFSERQGVKLLAIAIPMDTGVPFSDHANKFEVKDPSYRRP